MKKSLNRTYTRYFVNYADIYKLFTKSRELTRFIVTVQNFEQNCSRKGVKIWI